MPYRTFADDQGRSWEIWEVRPARVERRDSDRRQEPQPWSGPERRGTSSDRRQMPESRIQSDHPLAQGWLVFKSDDEKRRLAPIPENWNSCRGRELRDLWEQADVIVSRLDERSA